MRFNYSLPFLIVLEKFILKLALLPRDACAVGTLRMR